jgi:hypothetical protein
MSTELPTQVVIERRFCGPPDSGNGGYACGTVARFIDAPLAEVTLHLPPPLDTPMTVEREKDGARLAHDGNLVADGRPIADLQLAVPAPVGLAEAMVAAERSPLHHSHPFPTCFVCGPERPEGDGLRIIPGPVEGRELVAAPWTPDESLASDGDAVADEFCWAALDCPSGNALMLLDDVGTSVLGRLAVRVALEIEAGRDYVVAGWPLARDGRKIDTASVVFTSDGEPAAMARARWIELRTETLT